MDEAVLVDMMSELDPQLLENNYIEEDMTRERLPLFRRLFFIGKSFVFRDRDIAGKSADESPVSKQYRYRTKDADEGMPVDPSIQEVNPYSMGEEPGHTSINISVFTREFPLVKLVSGLAAALFVIGGIIVFLIKHKNIIKVFEENTQISY